MGFLDATGVTTLVEKLRTKFASQSDLNGKQPTLVSGTNIKTVNGNSLLGSGDLTVGGSVSYITTTATLTVAGWSNNTQTVNVTGVTESNDVIVAAAPASMSDYASGGVYCSAQAAGTLTFTCVIAPTNAITVNVMIFEGGVTPRQPALVIDNVTLEEGYYETTGTWKPIVGSTYDAHFTSSSSSTPYQGDITLTAVRMGASVALTPTPESPDEEWYVQFIGSSSITIDFWFYEDVTISLMVYDN